MLKLDDIGQL